MPGKQSPSLFAFPVGNCRSLKQSSMIGKNSESRMNSRFSVHTVHTHLELLYRKLGVSSRLGLFLSILSEYLSSLPSAFSLFHLRRVVLLHRLPTPLFAKPWVCNSVFASLVRHLKG